MYLFRKKRHAYHELDFLKNMILEINNTGTYVLELF